LFTPYPGDLNSVVLPQVTRTSKAGWHFCLLLVLTIFIFMYFLFQKFLDPNQWK
jgi:hypothetical protein